MVSGTQPDSPVGGDDVETGADAVAAGLIPPIRTRGDWEAVRALAAILEPEAFDWEQPADDRWREGTQWVAIAHAAKVITEGYIRVSVDDTTVEQVAAAMASNEGPAWPELHKDIRRVYRRLSRAAVQALRDGGTA